MNDRYTVVKVGGFSLGSFPTIGKAKKIIKACHKYGFFQVIDNTTGLAVWEGNN